MERVMLKKLMSPWKTTLQIVCLIWTSFSEKRLKGDTFDTLYWQFKLKIDQNNNLIACSKMMEGMVMDIKEWEVLVTYKVSRPASFFKISLFLTKLRTDKQKKKSVNHVFSYPCWKKKQSYEIKIFAHRLFHNYAIIKFQKILKWRKILLRDSVSYLVHEDGTWIDGLFVDFVCLFRC